MIDRLRSFIRGAVAPTESENDRDGFLSTYPEWHALAIGVYYGFIDFKDWDGLPETARDNPDVDSEIPTAKGGYVIGAVIRTLVVAGASIFVVTS